MTRSSLLVLTALLLLASSCPDDVPPEVEITSPADGDTLAGIVTVQARATDNGRVTQVELLVDDRLTGIDSTGRGGIYEFELNAAALALDTGHLLRCVAFDAAGNHDSSAAVTVFAGGGTSHSGVISSDQTWIPDDNPHLVSGDLAVRAVLTLRPGVVVQFRRGAGISVGYSGPGRIVAVGTPDSGIVITSAAASRAPGDWRSIRVGSADPADTSRFRHCLIEYGGSNGMLYADRSAVAVESCTLRASATSGLAAESGALAGCTGNSFVDCADFGLLVHPHDAEAVAADNSFAGNRRNGVGVMRGIVSRHTRWEHLGVPYYIDGTVDIGGDDNPSLSVAPGCSLRFADDARLRVGISGSGFLLANGTGGMIYFGPDTTGGTTDWPGIEFWHGADPDRTILFNCVVRRAGSRGGGALFCYAPVTITGCLVTGSRTDGVRCFGGGLRQFSSNAVTGSAGYPLRVLASDVGSIGSGNRLTGNDRDTILVEADQITANSQWRDHGIPYFVQGLISVSSPTAIPAMVIDQGVTIVFDRNSGLVIGDSALGGGTLFASGVPDSITLVGVDTVPGSWVGVVFDARTIGYALLDHCRVLYGGGGSWPGIVHVNRCSPEIRNNEIGWSPNYCVALIGSGLDPDSIVEWNYLHDWHPDFDPVYDEPGP